MRKFRNVLFQCDGVCGGAFLGIYDLGIDLSSGHILVGHHFADGVNVCAIAYKQCGKRVAQSVE